MCTSKGNKAKFAVGKGGILQTYCKLYYDRKYDGAYLYGQNYILIVSW